MKKRLATFIMALLLTITGAAPAIAADFEPPQNSDTWVNAYVTPAAVLAGDVFELGIEVDEVEDLYGYSIEIKFDEYVVDISDWQGNLLHNGNSDKPFNSENPLEGFELINRIDEGDTDEHLTYAVTKTGDVAGSDFVGEDGYAELAYLYFKVDPTMTGEALPNDYEFTITGDRAVYDAGQANVLVELSDSNGDPIAFQTDSASSVAYMYDPEAPTGEITLEWSGTPGYDLDAFFNINDIEYGWYNAGKLEAPPYVVFLEDDWTESPQDTAQEKFYYTQFTPNSYFHIDLFDVEDLSQNGGTITVTIDDYSKNNLDQTFNIADATGDGTEVWEVFKIDENGNIVGINELTDKADSPVIDAPTIRALANQTYTVWNDGTLAQSELTQDLYMDIELPQSAQSGYYDEQNHHFVGDVVVLEINNAADQDIFFTHEALTNESVTGGLASVEMLLDELTGIFTDGQTYQLAAWIERYDENGDQTGFSNDAEYLYFTYSEDAGGFILDAPTITALANQTDTVWNDGTLAQSEIESNPEIEDLFVDIILPDGVDVGSYNEQENYCTGDVLVLEILDNNGDSIYTTVSVLSADNVSNGSIAKPLYKDHIKDIFNNGESYKIVAWIDRHDNSGNIIGYSDKSNEISFSYLNDEGSQQSSDATVSSTLYTINDQAGTITDVPFGTELTTFVSYLVPANGASYYVYQADGITLATDLATGYKVIVTAEDGTTTSTYIVTLDEEIVGMSMKLDDKSGLNGSTISIPVTVENGELMAGFQFDIGYDNTVLRLDSFTRNDAFSGYMGSTNIDNQNGTVRILYTSNPIESYGTGSYALGTLNFTIIGTTGQTSNLVFSGVIISDNEMESIECQTTDGSVTVINVIYGDLNDDGNINIFDVMICINHAVGSSMLDAAHEVAADVTGEGDVNIFDVMQIINRAVGNIAIFPVEQ